MRTLDVYSFGDLSGDDKRRAVLSVVAKMIRGAWSGQYEFESAEAAVISADVEEEMKEEFERLISNDLMEKENMDAFMDSIPTDGDVIRETMMESGFMGAILPEAERAAKDIEYIYEDINRGTMFNFGEGRNDMIAYLLGEEGGQREEIRTLDELPDVIVESVSRFT
jgi:hypothetical protein